MLLACVLAYSNKVINIALKRNKKETVSFSGNALMQFQLV
jgi:hypothetical protein